MSTPSPNPHADRCPEHGYPLDVSVGTVSERCVLEANHDGDHVAFFPKGPWVVSHNWPR